MCLTSKHTLNTHASSGEGAFPSAFLLFLRNEWWTKPLTKFKSSTWIMDFLLPSLFVSLWNFYAPQNFSQIDFFFLLSFDGRITWIDFLFNSLRPLSGISRVSPRHRRQQVDPIKPWKSVGEWISREFQAKFKIPKASSRIVCLSLSELLFCDSRFVSTTLFLSMVEIFSPHVQSSEKSSKGCWYARCPTQARYLCATSRQ